MLAVSRDGVMLRTSCTEDDYDPNDLLIDVECDIEKGQSGSPLWEQNSNGRFVRGVCSFQSGGRDFFVQLTSRHVWWIMRLNGGAQAMHVLPCLSPDLKLLDELACIWMNMGAHRLRLSTGR